MTNTIQFSGGRVSILTITKPHSLEQKFLEELLSFLSSQMEPTTQVLIFTASHPEALLADVAALQPMNPKEAMAFSEVGQKVCAAIESVPFPVIGALDGAALGGGCELMLACDLLYASARAQLGQIEVRGGIIPGFGGTWRLPRRIGELSARELLYTGAVLDAEGAKSVGLVNDVFESADLSERVRAVAETIAGNGPLGVRAVKTMALANRGLSVESSNLLERQMFASLFATADQKEGMKAFVEKRNANFQGA